MGGDQCYPTASTTGYEDKAVGPYRAALPWVDGEQPGLYVLPGNHDWYDGLTSFMRMFCQGSSVGGWRTEQTRSYFAVRLPHHWWLLGIDIQFDSYIDDAQRRYFAKVAEQLGPDDAVILCSAKPSWIGGTDESPETYAVLDYFERTIIRSTGASVRVSLSGDRHHYARYAEQGGTGQKFTAGGGGAYLSPTHHLPSTLVLPPAASRAIGKTSPPATYTLQQTFPDAPTSRRLGLGIFRLPFQTRGLAALFGGLYLALALAIGGSAAPARSGGGRPPAGHGRGAADLERRRPVRRARPQLPGPAAVPAVPGQRGRVHQGQPHAEGRRRRAGARCGAPGRGRPGAGRAARGRGRPARAVAGTGVRAGAGGRGRPGRDRAGGRLPAAGRPAARPERQRALRRAGPTGLQEPAAPAPGPRRRPDRLPGQGGAGAPPVAARCRAGRPPTPGSPRPTAPWRST